MAAVAGGAEVAEARVAVVVVSLIGTARQARRTLLSSPSPSSPLTSIWPFSDSDKKVHQSWGGDDGKTELKFEEAATNDAAAETASDWNIPAVSNDWGAGDTAAADDAWAVPVPSSEVAPASPTAPDADKLGRDREGRRGREREPEEEDKTLTLDQYLAQKKESEVVPKLEGTRKANEGAEDTWKDIVPLKKDDVEDAYFVGKVGTCQI